jgi:hypothetical protein
MFEGLFVLIVLGLLYIEIIECLEKCNLPRTRPYEEPICSLKISLVLEECRRDDVYPPVGPRP